MSLPEYRIKLPLDLADVSGPAVYGKALLLGTRDDDSLAEVVDAPEEVSWFHDDIIDKMLVYIDEPENQLLVCREATREDFARLRVPWDLRPDDAPECCGKPMLFVSEFEDDQLCQEEPPADARLWFHDTVVFYVWTCSQCLGAKAWSQQY